MFTDYFSDRENGPRERDLELITPEIWRGLYALIDKKFEDGSFGNHFGKYCDQGLPFGCDKNCLKARIIADIPELTWPLDANKMPSLTIVFDLIEFCYRYIAKPERYGPLHTAEPDLFSSVWTFIQKPPVPHYHYSYNIQEGRQEFRVQINTIFSRNRLMFELDVDGHVIRRGPPVLREKLQHSVFETGDKDLDNLLENAREKFFSTDPDMRKEALDKLWDAWERIKTLEGSNKKETLRILFERISQYQDFRDKLNSEAKALTDIGNDYRIRHSEKTKIPIESSLQIDYLFHRLFSMIHLLISVTKGGL